MPEPTVQQEKALSPARRRDALCVVRFRASLDWMLLHPEWEGAVALAISALGFSGKRQGITFRKAALSLPIEHKFETLRLALQKGLEPPTETEAWRLSRLWGVTSAKRDPGRFRVSKRDWNDLAQTLLLRFSTRHARYKDAQENLYAAYQNLVQPCVYQVCRDRSKRDDALQEGRLALLQAIDNIDPEQNFEAYARHWMQRRIQNFLMRNRLPVKAPLNLISQTLREANERDPNLPSPANPRLAQALREGTLSLDAVSPDDLFGELSFSTNLGDARECPAADAASADDARLLSFALSQLTEKQQHTLAFRFGLPPARRCHSLAEVAQIEGISRQQIAQREKRALATLARCLAPVQAERPL